MAVSKKWSWLRILRVPLICAALATGSLSVVRDAFVLRGEAAPETALWAWLRICFVVACLIGWFQEHNRVRDVEEKIKPRLRIPAAVAEQPWVDNRGRCVSYYIDVLNESTATTVHGVEVKLTAIEPPALPWLPVPLHIKHDNYAPPRTEFTLNPGDKKQIDVVSSVAGAPVIDVVHIVGGVPINVPAGKYRLTVQASAKDTPPAVAKFEVWVDDTGYLRSVAL